MRRPRSIAKGAAAFLAVIVGLAAAVFYPRRVSVVAPPPPDYARGDAWLCRPGRRDPCAEPITTTILGQGGRTIETSRPDPKAPIDCFYLYPTVSHVRAAYAPIEATADIEGVVRDQLGPFTPLCRPYAPLYRQVTLAGLGLLFGHRRGVTAEVPYADVLAAWRHYLAHDNDGRGILLIGHSQGSRQLIKLMAQEIDGRPVAKRLVAAIVPGDTLDVPPGARVGGTLPTIPLCASDEQTGCVIAYSTFPAGRKPSDRAWLGAASKPGLRDACVGPPALLGTSRLDARLPVPAAMKDEIASDLVALPGLTAECREEGRFTVLAVSAEPAAKPTLDRLAPADPTSGLHSVDLGLAMGTLVEVARRQSAAYARHAKPG